MRNSEKILEDRLDIKNFIKDSIDVQILKGLIFKDRHKMLMPMLSLELMKNKEVKKKTNQRGRRQAMCLSQVSGDTGVFSIESAVRQLKMGMHKSEIESLVDLFFLENLPSDLLRKGRSKIIRDVDLSVVRSNSGSFRQTGGVSQFLTDQPNHRKINSNPRGGTLSNINPLPSSFDRSQFRVNRIIGEITSDKSIQGSVKAISKSSDPSSNFESAKKSNMGSGSHIKMKDNLEPLRAFK